MTTISTTPETSPDDWFPTSQATAAWMIALERTTAAWVGLWCSAVEAGVGALATQADVAARAAGMAWDVFGAPAAGRPAESRPASDEISQAALHVIEDMGPANPAFVPLPE
jgi:hypothetical protein